MSSASACGARTHCLIGIPLEAHVSACLVGAEVPRRRPVISAQLRLTNSHRLLRHQGHVGRTGAQVCGLPLSPIHGYCTVQPPPTPTTYVVKPSSLELHSRSRSPSGIHLHSAVLAHLVCPAEKTAGQIICPSLQLHSLTRRSLLPFAQYLISPTASCLALDL